MAEYTNPALPVVVGAGVGNNYDDHCKGFDPASAALVGQGDAAVQRQLLQESVNRNSKESALSQMESRFQLERSLKENSIQAERLERENQRVITAEHDKTRALMMQLDNERKVAEATNGRFSAIEAILAKLVAGGGE